MKEIWKELKKDYGIHLNLKNFVHIRQWLMDWLTQAFEFHLMIFAVAVWHIWENRNSCRNGEVLPHPTRVAGRTKAYIDFILLNSNRLAGSNRRETSTSVQKWFPPPEGLLMINVDAAIFSESGRAGFGVVMRDHQGLVRAACRGFFNHVHCREVAEAHAVRQVLILAENMGVQMFQVASDCLSVIRKIQQQGMDRSLTGAIVHDIKSRATKFTSCTFRHVVRTCNEAAHVLAKSAEQDSGSCWFNECPDIIRAIICYEQ